MGILNIYFTNVTYLYSDEIITIYYRRSNIIELTKWREK